MRRLCVPASTYAAELESKHRRVQSAFRQAGLADVRVPAAAFDRQDGGLSQQGDVPGAGRQKRDAGGLYAAKSHRLIPCADCALQPPAFAGVVGTVCRFVTASTFPLMTKQPVRGFCGISTCALRRQERSWSALVINADGLPGGRAAEARLVDCLLAEQPRTVSVLLNINRRNTNVVLGEQYRKLYGSGWIEDTLCGLRFRLSAGSFYQVNREGARAAV